MDVRERILRALDRHGPLSPAEMPRGWPITRLHALRALRELEGRGFVEPVTSDGDGQPPRRLTRAGRRELEIAEWDRAIRLAGLDGPYEPN